MKKYTKTEIEHLLKAIDANLESTTEIIVIAQLAKAKALELPDAFRIEPGSGRYAAKLLSSSILNSIVVKVSASGGKLTIWNDPNGFREKVH